jgi:hypothetical protein
MFTTSGAGLCRTGVRCGCRGRADKTRGTYAGRPSGLVRTNEKYVSKTAAESARRRTFGAGTVRVGCRQLGGRRAKKACKNDGCATAGICGHRALPLTSLATRTLRNGREIALPDAHLSRPPKPRRSRREGGRLAPEPSGSGAGPGDNRRRLSAVALLLRDARANSTRAPLTSTSPISEPDSSAERRAWRPRAHRYVEQRATEHQQTPQRCRHLVGTRRWRFSTWGCRGSVARRNLW